MPEVSMRNMLEAGVHFGHQTHRWNPKMKPFIYGPRNGIYIIDLEKTVKHAKEACAFIKTTVADGGKVLFVATKNQAATITKEAATQCNMPYVSERWLGGTLTNFATIRRGCEKLDEMDRLRADGTYEAFKKKERVMFDRKQEKLEASLGGIRHMRHLPSALFIIDPMTEDIAVREANRLGIPVVALVDTNCDPDRVDYVIPGNDDALKSVTLFVNLIADSCAEGAAIYEQKARIAQGQTATEAKAAKVEKTEKVAAGPVVEKVKRPKLLNIPTEIDYRDASLLEEEEAPEAPEAPEVGSTEGKE
ncbi:MAG: 30S ribosomal protein S2 [Proteobacteria bacterium]|nr:30S ribosomal protein S2 [Pseudomonadota bacterium]NDD03718.1 30S ribosomal protein S2 [Pseudomonadota bacterium]